MNWRDRANPDAGGAETFTEEIAKRLVSRGDQVNIFTSSFEGCDPITERYGIKIIRDGGRYTVYSKAREYVKHNLSKYDLVIDEINTVPFRAYKIAKGIPVIALIHQLAKEIWFYETRFPINIIGYAALEPLWLRGYRHIPTVTVSGSTQADLAQRGFEKIKVIHNGIGVVPLNQVPQKESKPVLVFLGRLVKCKMPQHAIRAFKLVKTSLPSAELWIIGDGYLRRRLERDCTDGITFFGRVSEKEKFELLQRAHVILAPSVREGWGISVLEANATGTPAVGYDVPGLRDSIIHEKTGVLVTQFDIPAMANAARRVVRNSMETGEFSRSALEWSRRFNWDDSAKEFHSYLDFCDQQFSAAT